MSKKRAKEILIFILSIVVNSSNISCNTLINRIDEEALDCGSDFVGGKYFVVKAPDGRKLSKDEIQMLPISEEGNVYDSISSKGCISAPSEGRYLVRSLQYDWISVFDSEKLDVSGVINLQDNNSENLAVVCDEKNPIAVNHSFAVKDFISESISSELKDIYRVKYELTRQGEQGGAQSNLGLKDLDSLGRPFTLLSKEGVYVLKLHILNLAKMRELSSKNCLIKFDSSPPLVQFSVNQTIDFGTIEVHGTKGIALVNQSDTVGFISRDPDTKEVSYCIEVMDDNFGSSDAELEQKWLHAKNSLSCENSKVYKIEPNIAIGTDSRSGFSVIRYQATDKLGNIGPMKSQIFLFLHRESIELTKNALESKVNAAILENRSLDAAKAALGASEFRKSLPTLYERQLLSDHVQSALLKVFNEGSVAISLKGHSISPEELVFTSEGSTLITASSDKKLIFWNAKTGAIENNIEIDRGYLTSLVIDPEKNRLFAGSIDGSIRTWDIGSRKELHPLLGHKSAVWGVSIGPSGKMASISELGEIIIWDTHNEQPIITFGSDVNGFEKSYGYISISFSPDGSKVVSSNANGVATVSDVATGRAIKVLNSPTGEKNSPVRFSKDGRYIVSGSANDIILWDSKNEWLASPVGLSTGYISSLSWGSGGMSVAAGALGGIYLFPLMSQSVREKEFWPNGARFQAAASVALSPDNSQLAVHTGFASDPLQIWSFLHELTPLSIRSKGDSWGSLYIDDSGRSLISMNPDSSLDKWNLESRENLQTIAAQEIKYDFVEVSADRTISASLKREGSIRIINLATQKIICEIASDVTDLNFLAITPDNRFVVAGAMNAAIFWDARTGVKVRVLEGDFGRPQAFAFSPDSKYLYLSEMKGRISIWDLSKNIIVGNLEGHRGVARPLKVSKDGTTLFSSGRDNLIKIWNLKDRSLTRTLEGHKEWVEFIALSPDERLIASASKDQHVKIWNASDGREMADFKSSSRSAFQKVLFSPDGKKLVAEEEGGKIGIYDLDIDELSRRLCAAVKGFIQPQACSEAP